MDRATSLNALGRCLTASKLLDDFLDIGAQSCLYTRSGAARSGICCVSGRVNGCWYARMLVCRQPVKRARKRLDGFCVTGRLSRPPGTQVPLYSVWSAYNGCFGVVVLMPVDVWWILVVLVYSMMHVLGVPLLGLFLLSVWMIFLHLYTRCSSSSRSRRPPPLKGAAAKRERWNEVLRNDLGLTLHILVRSF